VAELAFFLGVLAYAANKAAFVVEDAGGSEEKAKIRRLRSRPKDSVKLAVFSLSFPALLLYELVGGESSSSSLSEEAPEVELDREVAGAEEFCLFGIKRSYCCVNNKSTVTGN